MNNKSTENLIQTEENVQDLEFDVPSVDLENSKVSSLTKLIGEQKNADHPKRVTNSFLVEKSVIELKTIPPVPAIRRFSLAPIESKRNSKDVKEDCNQLVWKQSLPNDDTIQIVDEHNTESHNSRKSSSDSNKHQKSAGHEKCNNIELSMLDKNKKKFISSQVNEETTSFISYEEKHEREDNSEHSNSSNARNLLNDKNGSRENAAFVQDSDDNSLLDDENLEKVVEKSKTVAKKGKLKKKASKVKRSKKMKLKRSHDHREKQEDIELTEEHESHETYDFKKLIGVWIHQTSALRFDSLIRQPRVRVSFYDLNNDQLLNKSNPLRNAVSNYEPTNVTFIQPILSNRCKFKVSSEIECDWNDEVLLINEDIRHIQNDYVIIFFEIVDIMISNGWYPICWAFLRPGNNKTYSNLNVRCDLQLYHYQRKSKNNIMNEWKSQKKIKYPANLSVTVASYQHKSIQSVSLTRPMSVLEEEVTEDIYTCGTDDGKISEQSYKNNETISNERSQHFNDQSNRSETKMLNLKPRLPGQQCKCPNRLIYKYELTNHIRGHGTHTQYGSMIVKFSPNGSQLAFHLTAYLRSNHELIIMNATTLQVSHTLTGHLNIIYDIDWLNENILISVASDRTAIVWFLNDNSFSIKVLPHPSFVYVTKWLSKSSECAYAVTGGRDSVLRIWKINMEIDTDIELFDELLQHDNYITSLAVTYKSISLYSADWNGVLLEWKRSKIHKENDDGPAYQMCRKIKIFPRSIIRMELHLKSNRMFVQCIDDPLIYVIETTSAVVVKTINYVGGDHIKPELQNTFTVSPCGSLIFTKSPYEDQIKCIRISNEENAGQFPIPISLITKKYAVTSISYNSNKDLIACTIFGDLIHSCLFLFYNDADGTTKIISTNDDTNMAHDTMLNLQEWYNIRTQESINTDGINSILNRIDELFFMAIRSSIVENDQFKDMELFLRKLSLESKTMPSNGGRTTKEKEKEKEKENEDTYSRDFRDSRISTRTNDPENSVHMASIENASLTSFKSQFSSESRHTYQITKPIKSNQKHNHMNMNEEHSELSEASNITFDIRKSELC